MMKRISFRSIRTRLIYGFLLLSLVPLLIALVITYFQRVQVIESRTFDKLTAIRELKVQQLTRWLDERNGDLMTIAGDYEVRGLEYIFEKESKSSDDIAKLSAARDLMYRNLFYYSAYSEIFIVDANTGLIAISTNRASEGINKSSDAYFSTPLETGEMYIKDIYNSPSTNKTAMTLSLPLYCLDHGIHVIGILVARIDLDGSLYKLLHDRVGLGTTGETLIVNKDVVALNELRWYDDAPLNLQISAEPARNAAQGKTGITVTPDYRGEDVLAAYTYIPETGWGFVCKQDMHELRSPIRRMIWNFMILFVISGLIIVLIAIYISKSISKPVIEMERVSRKISAGDFSERIEIISSDELGNLARGFNVMLDATSSRMKIQQGVADISETMIGQSSLQDFGKALLKQLMKFSGASMSTFYILNEAVGLFEHFVSVGANEELLKAFNAENPEGEFGNALSGESIYYLRNIPENTIFKFRTTAGDVIPREIITIPVRVDGKVLALISLVNIQKFSDECFEILQQSWSSINTSYSNLTAGEKTRALAEQLSRTNQQLESQSEELQAQAEELQQQTEELQEQNLELEAQREQVESSSRLKSEFLSNMSHELRTPLNSILALSRVLIMRVPGKLDAEEINYLGIVERNGKQLLALINDILDLSKIEAGKMDVACREVSLLSILSVIVEGQEIIADKKGISIEMEAPDDLPPIETDEIKLHHALINIIGNAVKFTDKGKVEISVTHDSQNAYIRITDSGIGIPEESIDSIFDEFRQVDGSSSREYEGTGLGLAIARKMIKVLGGSIHVESELDVGSVFTVSLPLFCGKELSTSESRNPHYSESKSSAITDQRILLVEDNEVSIIQVKMVLESEGFLVDVATGGKQALDYLITTVPDAIILDLMMPELDGFDVLDRIRNLETHRHIPVLVLSAKDLQRKDMERLQYNNVNQILQKGDISKKELLSKVNSMLGISAPSQAEKAREKREITPEKAGKRPVTSKLPGILVVEDNRDNMTVINAILKDNFRVWNAFNGEDGYHMAKDHIPDMILLDMSLPGMDGLSVVQYLKKNPSTSEIPVIAVSARAMKADIEAFLKGGCNDCVTKPIDVDELLGKIKKWVNN
jgi:signal transduction histidine kinase/CheY-like chemotaxis protein/HAMP domain-containing protein